MCCGNLCFLKVGCRSNPTKIDDPEGYSPAPKRVLCTLCGNVGDSQYMHDEYSCHICFIPCFSCGSSSPYLCCGSCERNLGGMKEYRCQKCDVATMFESNNCPNCGEHKEHTNGGYRMLGLK